MNEERRREAEISAVTAELESRVALRTDELELERRQLEAVIDQMPAGVVIIEAPSGKFRLANAEAERIVGASVAGWGIKQWTAMRAVRPDGSEYSPHERPLARSMLRGETVVGEVICLERPDGVATWIEVSSAPLHLGDGPVSSVVAIFHDITERRRREQAQRDFVINAAHELQTPLTAIASAVEVLQAGAKEVAADRNRFLGHIQDECDRLARLVRALLQLARAEIGEEAPPLEAVPVRALLDEVVSRVRTRPGVVVDVRAPARLRAHTNAQLVEQALLNVVGNAANYTTAGSISLSARAMDDDYLAVEVVDTGPGITPEERERVFERFFRGGGRSRDGFGLGLAIAAQATRLLGGRLELGEDDAGAGTTVRLVLPRRAPR